MSVDCCRPDWLDADPSGHRLWLCRRVGEGPDALLVMCNPSTADDRDDDWTIKSVKRIFGHHGFGCITVVNLFTKRETDQRMLDCGDPASNDSQADNVLRRAFQEHETVIFAWGAGSQVKRRCAYGKRRMLSKRWHLKQRGSRYAWA